MSLKLFIFITISLLFSGVVNADKLEELLADGIPGAKQELNPKLEDLLGDGIVTKSYIEKTQNDLDSTSELERLLNEGLTDSPSAVPKIDSKTLPAQQTKNVMPANVNTNALEDLLGDGITGPKTERDIVLQKPDKVEKSPEQEIEIQAQPESAQDEQIVLEIEKLKTQLQQAKEQARQQVEAEKAKTQLLEKKLTEIESQKRELQTSLKNQAISEIEQLNEDIEKITALSRQEPSAVKNINNEIEPELSQAQELSAQSSETLQLKQTTSQLQTYLDQAKLKALQQLGSDSAQEPEVASRDTTQRQFTELEHYLMDSDEYDPSQTHLISDVMLSNQQKINQQELEFTGGYEQVFGNHDYVPEQDFIRPTDLHTQSIAASSNTSNELAKVQLNHLDNKQTISEMSDDSEESSNAQTISEESGGEQTVLEESDDENSVSQASIVSDLRSRLVDTIDSLNLKLSTQFDTNSKDYKELKLQIETLQTTFAKLDEITTIEPTTEKLKVEQSKTGLSQTSDSLTNGYHLQNESESKSTMVDGQKSEKQSNSCRKFPNLCKNLTVDQ